MSEWHKSSYSGATNECVEVREQAGSANIRDTQHRDLGYLSIPAIEWAAFLEDIKADRL